jgi:uncharacterized Zn finger protein
MPRTTGGAYGYGYGSSGSSRWYPPPSVPLPADGIRARSRRGEIGETWWSQRFLESFDMGSRLVRGRRYARAGQVLDLDIEPGTVTAHVQGSRPTPYRVSIGVLTLSSKDWSRVEQVMASRAIFLAKLLAGEMPRDIEEAFAESKLSLFPATARDLTSDCTCPDWANPCKHVAATYYLLAEAFDADPFLILRWRGRDRAELLTGLIAQPAAGASDAAAATSVLWDVPAVEVPALADAVDRFWDVDTEASPSPELPRRAPGPVVVADAIVRGLDPRILEMSGRSIVEVLAPAYAAITAAARGEILGREHGSRPATTRRAQSSDAAFARGRGQHREEDDR